MDKRVMPALKIPESQIRKLDITDTERIERFRTAGYGGNVSDALWALGICNTVLSQQFKALRDVYKRQMSVTCTMAAILARY